MQCKRSPNSPLTALFRGVVAMAAMSMAAGLVGTAGCGKSEVAAQSAETNKANAERAGVAGGNAEARSAKPPFDPTR